MASQARSLSPSHANVWGQRHLVLVAAASAASRPSSSTSTGIRRDAKDAVLVAVERASISVL
jgi:hypothetical protein